MPPTTEGGRSFDLGDVLTITTGRLLSSRHMDGVYDVLNFLTGDNLFTHQLPRAERYCRPFVLEQHPDLDLDVPADLEGEEPVREWLAEAKLRFGEARVLEPAPGWEHQNPIEELADRVGAERVWVVPTEDAL